MSVQARWGRRSTTPEPGDPFAEPKRVEDVGMPIDLRDEPVLNTRLVELVQLEGLLYERGVRCELKDREDTTCSACPVRCKDPSEPLFALCNLGREEEVVLTELAARRLGLEGS